jgi:hypothetical protein
LKFLCTKIKNVRFVFFGFVPIIYFVQIHLKFIKIDKLYRKRQETGCFLSSATRRDAAGNKSGEQNNPVGVSGE